MHVSWGLSYFYIMCRWKLVDSVEPKHNAISFFDIDRPETAVSRWSRAMTKAAMVRIGSLLKESFSRTVTFNSEIKDFFQCWQVGKGLSKAEKARKLALQHWLEAVSSILCFQLHFKHTKSLSLFFSLTSFRTSVYRLILVIATVTIFNFIMPSGFNVTADKPSSIGKLCFDLEKIN